MSNRVPIFLAAIIFLIGAAAGLYRLLIGFPIIVGGLPIGQTASFFTFVICAALSFIFFKAAVART
jgi:hypothetical protein